MSLATQISALSTRIGAECKALWAAVNGKEPAIAAGTTAQYLRGDKTWGTPPAAPVPVQPGPPTTTLTGFLWWDSDDTTSAGPYEPAIAAGTTAQYLRGDKTWQTLNPTAVGAEPAFAAGTTAQYRRGDKTWQTLNPTAVGAEPAFAAGTTAQYRRGDKTWQTLNAAAVGLSNVTNEAQMTETGGGKELVVTGLAVSAGLVTCDLNAGNIFMTANAPTANFQIVFSNIPTGVGVSARVIVDQGATVRTVTMPAGTIHWFGPQPTQVASKDTMYDFFTLDGGTNWYVSAAVES